MKQSAYIIRGFLLLLVLVIAVWFMNILLNIRPTPSDKHNKQELTVVETKPVVINQKGQQLFRENCNACHAINKDIMGPALATIEERVPDRKLIYAWIRNSQAVLKSGNKYFNKLYLSFNKVGMSQFPELTDSDIDAILEYIKQAAAQQYLPVPAVAAN